MKKLLLILPLLVLFACNNTSKNDSNSDKATTKVDTLWNDTVQDTFFDTKFGATIEEVEKNFEKHIFKDSVFEVHDNSREIPMERDQRVDDMRFEKIFFGGYLWETVLVEFYYNKFGGVKFYSPHGNFNQLEMLFSKKYKFTEIEPEDTTILSKKIAFGKNGCQLSIIHFRNNVELIYRNDNIINGPKKSDEEILEDI